MLNGRDGTSTLHFLDNLERQKNKYINKATFENKVLFMQKVEVLFGKYF